MLGQTSSFVFNTLSLLNFCHELHNYMYDNNCHKYDTFMDRNIQLSLFLISNFDLAKANMDGMHRSTCKLQC